MQRESGTTSAPNEQNRRPCLAYERDGTRGVTHLVLIPALSDSGFGIRASQRASNSPVDGQEKKLSVKLFPSFFHGSIFAVSSKNKQEFNQSLNIHLFRTCITTKTDETNIETERSISDLQER